jgi:hypothetical protein
MASANSPASFYYPLCQISGRLVGQPGGLPPLVVGPSKPNFNIGLYNPFVIQGDYTYPLGAFFVSGDFSMPSSGPAFSMTDGAAIKLTGLSFDSGAAAQDCMDVMNGSFIDVSYLEWGACGSGSGSANYNIGLGIAFNSNAFVTGPLTLSSGHMNAFIQLGENSSLYPNTNGVTKQNIAMGSPSFVTAAIVVGGSSALYIQGLSFSGSFTGNGLVDVESSMVESGTGAGPNTCPANLVLSQPLIVQDYSVCR